MERLAEVLRRLADLLRPPRPATYTVSGSIWAERELLDVIQRLAR